MRQTPHEHPDQDEWITGPYRSDAENDRHNSVDKNADGVKSDGFDLTLNEVIIYP